MGDPAAGEWAALSDAAARLGLSEKKLRKQIKRGTITVGVRVAPAPDAATECTVARDETATELVRLVSRLQEENRTLAGQLGYVQAQLQQTRDALGEARETIQALAAPPPEPPMVQAVVMHAPIIPSEPAVSSAPSVETTGTGIPSPRPRSRWRFWRRGNR